jgi:uncharacterized protein
MTLLQLGRKGQRRPAPARDPEPVRQSHVFATAHGVHALVVDGSRIYSIDDETAAELRRDPANVSRRLDQLGLLDPAAPYVTDEAPRAVAVRSLSLAIAQKCNLACTYCYAQEGSFGAEPKNMEREAALASLDLLFQGAAAGERVNLAFLGGEPLVNRPLLRECTERAVEMGERRSIRTNLSITTNGTLIQPSDGDFFERHGFAVTVSLDGTGETHDKQRPFRGGQGSYARILANVRPLLAMQRRMQVSARVTVTPGNLRLRETLDELLSLGFHSVGFSPVLHAPSGNAEMTEGALEEMLEQMIDCGEEFMRRTVIGERYAFANLVTAVQELHKGTHRPYPCGAGGGYFGVAAGGELYACHRFVDDPEARFGDVWSGVDAGAQARWLEERHVHAQSPCKSCWARYLCGGAATTRSFTAGAPPATTFAAGSTTRSRPTCASGPRRRDTLADGRRGERAAGGGVFDVCIVGGGPAGASLALRLAQLGRRVAVAERAVFPRPHIGESLSSGILPLLETLGVRSAVESAGFLSSSWATVEWAGERRRYRVHGGPGILVDRARFDALLLDAASAMPGVCLLQPAGVVCAARARDHWEVALDTGARLRASYLAEASGRSRVRLSPRPRARPRAKLSIGPQTLALYAYWRGAGGDGDPETLVEAGQDAWYWGAPLPGGEFSATVFVDPGPAPDYDVLIRRSKLLGPRLCGASRESEVRVCDATPFADPAPVTAASIKVGDAALSIDPLSSQGVQTAVGTALHAAVVLNTMMDRPEDADLAIDFYRSRVGDSAGFHAAAAADFYRRQATSDGGDFWRRRAPGAVPPAPRGPLPPEARVARSSGVLFTPVAVADASHVVRRDGVKARGKSYAFVGEGIAVAPLLREIDGPMTAFDVVRRWSRRLPAAQALQVLRWAWSEDLVCPEG